MIKYIFSLCFLIFTFPSFATSETTLDSANKQTTLKEAEIAYQKVITEYREHLSKVPKEVREEIKNFRLEIAKLQAKKRDVYSKLSVQAQEYLKTEDQFRKKLPVDKEGRIEVKDSASVSQPIQSNR
jgi:hypothetical protein